MVLNTFRKRHYHAHSSYGHIFFPISHDTLTAGIPRPGLVNHAKVGFLARAVRYARSQKPEPNISSPPFGHVPETTHYFWLDAGVSRFPGWWAATQNPKAASRYLRPMLHPHKITLVADVHILRKILGLSVRFFLGASLEGSERREFVEGIWAARTYEVEVEENTETRNLSALQRALPAEPKRTFPDLAAYLSSLPPATRSELESPYWDRAGVHIEVPIGTFWGGPAEKILELEPKYLKIVEELLDRGPILDDDQPVLLLLLLRFPEMFHVMHGNFGALRVLGGAEGSGHSR